MQTINRARKAVVDMSTLPQTAVMRTNRFQAHFEVLGERKLSKEQREEVLSLEILAQGIADGVCTVINNTPCESRAGLGPYQRQWLLESVVSVLESRV